MTTNPPPVSEPAPASLPALSGPAGGLQPEFFEPIRLAESAVDLPKPLPDIKLETTGITSHPGNTSHDRQRTIWADRTTHKNSIAAKLRESGRSDLADTLEACHTQRSYCHCGDCGRVTVFLNRCDLRICPECAPSLARERQRAVEWWTKQVSQPKHVVLTLANTPTISKADFAELKAAFSRLRRTRLARNWRGGFYSIELTNEGRGWHLHIHALIDAHFIPADQLARAWAQATRGKGHIVKVKDARDQSYLRELVKYVAKGSDLARWSPSDLRAFVEAIEGVRCFGVFGSCYGRRADYAAWLDELISQRGICPCGSRNCTIMTEFEHFERDAASRTATSPPPKPRHVQMDTLLGVVSARFN